MLPKKRCRWTATTWNILRIFRLWDVSMTGALSAHPCLKSFKRLKFRLGCSRLSPENNTTNTHFLHPVQTISLNICTCFPALPLCKANASVPSISSLNFFLHFSTCHLFLGNTLHPLHLPWPWGGWNIAKIPPTSPFFWENGCFLKNFDSSLSCAVVEKLFLDWGCTLWLWLAFIIDTSNVLHVPFFCSLPYLPKSSRAAVRFGVGETEYL